MSLAIFISFVIIQRFLELNLARRNEKWAKSRGAIEYGQEHYRLFFLLHTSWLISLLIETILGNKYTANPSILWLCIFILAQFGRYWVIKTLGNYWNTKILVIPGLKLIKNGPYRFVKHPNYLIVAIELFSGSLIFGAWITACIVSVLNAVLLLLIRIPVEEKALKMNTQLDENP